LAILLRTGRHGQNAIALARETINKFGGLNGLMTATQEDLSEIKSALNGIRYTHGKEKHV
jgi:DNA repair protein RadC